MIPYNKLKPYECVWTILTNDKTNKLNAELCEVMEFHRTAKNDIPIYRYENQTSPYTMVKIQNLFQTREEAEAELKRLLS